MRGQSFFLKGFNQDGTYDRLPEGFYFSADNMRVLTSDGGTTGSLENIKGNLFKITYPEVAEVFRFMASSFAAVGQFTWSFNINGSITKIFNTEQTYQAMADAINNDGLFSSMGVVAYAQTSDELYTDNSLTITMKDTSRINTINLYSNTVGILMQDYRGDPATGQQTVNIAWSSIAYRASVLNIRTIGWINMRDDIILWTTNETAENPVNSLGQIWRLSYNKITLDCTLTLLYNNYLNLSTAHPIATPGQALARYETPEIQRVYWTDNYNAPRTCNVVDPDLFAKDPKLLTLDSIVSPYIMIPQVINQGGGSLKTGVHQVAYRLNETGGGKTSWFLPSYPIYIVESPEGSDPIVDIAPFGSNPGTPKFEVVGMGYDGAPDGLTPTDSGHDSFFVNKTTGKSIRYEIGIVDDNYSTIEIAHIYRLTEKSQPLIDIIAEEPVTGTTFSYTLTGDENKIPITLEEFNGYNQAFDRVGTINTKDDYLFLGDVTLKKLDVDYDTRAFRFNQDRFSTLNSSSGGAVIVDGTPVNIVWNVPTEHDCINNNDGPIPVKALGGTTVTNNIYQSDGVTIGGEGPNISYQFILEDFELDSHNMGALEPAPYRHSTASASTSYDINSTTPHTQTIFNPNCYRDYHSPYMSGAMRGYTRDEVYRYAVVFYDQQGNPGWASWIGDIRFPHVWMPNQAGNADRWDRSVQFPTCYTDSGVQGMGRILGIQFTVNNLETLPEEVGGYSIVRVKRDFQNRSVIGQGLWHPAIFDDKFPGGQHRIPHSDNATFDVNAGAWTTNRLPSTIVSMLLSPEFQVTGTSSNIGYIAGDYLDIVGLMNETDNAQLMDNGGGGGSTLNDFVHKNYTFKATCFPITDPLGTLAEMTPYDITHNERIPAWIESSYVDHQINGLTCTNHSHYSGLGDSNNPAGAQGVRSQVLTHAGTQNIIGSELFGWSPTSREYGVLDGFYTGTTYVNETQIYLANYKRSFNSGGSVVSSQYNSNTYQGRSTATYISTNHYQKIVKGTTTYINNVFGGDTYICIYDVWRDVHDHSSGTIGNRFTTLKLFPVETYYNIEMRQAHGPWDAYKGPAIPNKHFVKTDEDPLIEQLIINPTLSTENDIRKFFPKPFPYVEQFEFDTRIYNNSFPKINGETYDQWKIIKSSDFIQADTEHGKVSALINHQDKIVFFQDRAVGIYQVNEKSIVPDQTGSSIVLGTGGIGERTDYLTTKIGSFHRFGIAQSPDSVIFFDMFSKKLYLLSGKGLGSVSDIKGLSGVLERYTTGNLLTDDNPVRGDLLATFPAGITSTFDYRYNEFLVTLHDSKDVTYIQEGGNLILEGTFNDVVQTFGPELVRDVTDTINLTTNTGVMGTDLFDLPTNFPPSFSDPNIWIVDASTPNPWDIDPATSGGFRARVTNTALDPYFTQMYYNGASTGALAITFGKDYRLSYDLVITTGVINEIYALGNQLLIGNPPGLSIGGTYTHDLTATDPAPDQGAFGIQTDGGKAAGSNFTGSLDNVSITEIIYALGAGSGWTVISGVWTFKNNKATKSSTASAGELNYTITPIPALIDRYKIKFRITDSNNAGAITTSLAGSVLTPAVNADGYYEYIIQPLLTNGTFIINASAPFLGSISEVEVYKLAQDDPGFYNTFTVAYNELTQEFTSFYDLTPTMWINNKRNIITPVFDRSNESLYFWDEGNYGEFYGVKFPSTVTTILGMHPQLEKVFNSIMLNTKVYNTTGVDRISEPILNDVRETFDKYLVYNTYQNTGERVVNSTNSRFIKRKWNLSIGGNKLVEQILPSGLPNPAFISVLDGAFEAKSYTERIKSNYAFAKFIYNNDDNYRLVTESLVYNFMINPTNGGQ